MLTEKLKPSALGKDIRKALTRRRTHELMDRMPDGAKRCCRANQLEARDRLGGFELNERGCPPAHALENREAVESVVSTDADGENASSVQRPA